MSTKKFTVVKGGIQARQGDIAFFQVRDISKPEDTEVKANYTVALGEVTGHSHVLEAENEVGVIDGIVFVVAEEETQVVHQEHAPITILPAEYIIGRQAEYSPEEERLVLD